MSSAKRVTLLIIDWIEKDQNTSTNSQTHFCQTQTIKMQAHLAGLGDAILQWARPAGWVESPLSVSWNLYCSRTMKSYLLLHHRAGHLQNLKMLHLLRLDTWSLSFLDR